MSPGSTGTVMRPDPHRPVATSEKPKLLVLRSPTVDERAVAEALSDAFDVVEASPEEAMSALAREDPRAVLAGAGDFLPLERELLEHQSNILLNAIGEGVCLADRTGGIVWANDRFRSFEAILHRRLADVVSTAAAYFDSLLNRRRRKAEETGDVDAAETHHGFLPPKRYNLALRKTQRYFDCIVTPVFPPAMPGGEPPVRVNRLAVVIRDVTSRERVQRRINALDRAGRELIHIEPDVVRTMNAADRLAELEKRVARIAHDLLSFDHFSVRLLDEKTLELKMVMAVGLPREAVDIQLYAETEGQGISGYVASTGNSYSCPDASADDRYVFGMEHSGSSLTVAIRLFDKIIGVLNVESEEVAAFSEQDRQFAEIFASYLAMSFHILNLLVVERSTTREDTTGTIQGELAASLNDLTIDIETLKERASDNEQVAPAVEQLLKDVADIRRKMKRVASGPQTLLGVDEAMAGETRDPVLRARRILVVDNEPTMLETIRDILKARGSRVASAKDGATAIRLLEQWRLTHDQTEAFDLVISDINLGDATGYDVFAAAKHVNPDLPVILMTGFGYDPHHSIVRASQEGLQSVLFKPFQAQSLIDESRKAIDPDASEAPRDDPADDSAS
jgi:CheY-like chemotaxis protein